MSLCLYYIYQAHFQKLSALWKGSLLNFLLELPPVKPADTFQFHKNEKIKMADGMVSLQVSLQFPS